MTALQFRVLGPLEVRRNGSPVPIAAPKQRALLGLLLLHANEPVSQDELIDQLWGDRAPPTARASLQNQVYALRKLLGPETLERDARGYVIHVEPGELDLEQFERLVTEAHRCEPKERAAKLREALALWRGPPLVESPLEPFMQPEIARLEEAWLTALESRVDAELALGLHGDLASELTTLVERYPLRERIWGQLMLALYRGGRQADALAAYRRAHHAFVDELGVEPGVDLRELHRAILVQDAALDDSEHRIGWTLERAAAILPWSPHERAESLYEYALALYRTGEPRRALSSLEAAVRMAAAAGDESVEDRARLYLSYFSQWTQGKSQLEFLTEAERASERFEERSDGKGLAVALRHRYQTLSALGRADEAAELALRAAELAAERDDSLEEAAALVNRAEALANGSTSVERAIRECEEMLEAGLRRDLWSPPPLPLRLLAALGSLYAQAGRIEDARGVLQQAVDQARQGGLLWFLAGMTFELGEAEFIVGNLAEAAGHMRSAHALVETEDDHVFKPQLAGELACVLALSGDAGEARQLALDARAISSGDFALEVLWRRALALVAASEGQFKEARMLSDEARARANASDWLTFRGQTLEEAARVRELSGDSVGATTALEEALAAYEQKGNVAGAQRVRSRLGGARCGDDA